MNSAGITRADLRLRDVLRRLDARRAVPRQHRGARDLRRHERLGGGRRRRPRHGRDRGDDATRATTPRPRRAITAASATIGPIIPPSLPMIIYGVDRRDVDRRAVPRRDHPGPADGGGADGDGARRSPAAATSRAIRSRRCASVIRASREAFWALMAPVILFGGILSGVFTPTEAPRSPSLYALVLGLFVYREFALERPAAAHPRHGRDHRRRDGAGDDGVAARLLPLGVAPAAGVRRCAAGRRSRTNPGLPADRQPGAAGRRAASWRRSRRCWS